MGAVRHIAIALALASIALPASAQFSDSFSFLQGVKDRDGQKATDALNHNKAVAATRDPKTGESSTHIVVRRHDQTWLSFLLANGAPADGKDNQGLTPLMIAAQTGDAEAARMLLSVGARVNAINNSGETPLIMAVHARDTVMTRLLITSGADPKLKDTIAGKSALDYATEDPRGSAVLRILAEAKPKAAPSGPIAGPQIR
jgi:uncharacterized protein